MHIQYIIFDYGGTLDTNGIHWAKLIWHFYQKYKVNITHETFYSAYVFAERTLGSQNIIQPTDTFLKTLQTKLTLQLNWLQENHHLALSDNELTELHQCLTDSLYDFAKTTVSSNTPMLQSLKDKGYHLALVSNFYGNIHAVLNEMNISSYFEVIIESATVGIRKPDPAIYSLAAKQLGATNPDAVLVIGDSLEKDIIPAASLGFHTTWVRDHLNSPDSIPHE